MSVTWGRKWLPAVLIWEWAVVTVIVREQGRKGIFRAFYTDTMFSRKLRVEYEANGQRQPAPLKWLDSFAMRNFTNDQVFDDTLPVGDGVLEIGARVPLDRLKTAMEDWFRRKGYLKKDAELFVAEM
jgi:hypothetical protein